MKHIFYNFYYLFLIRLKGMRILVQYIMNYKVDDILYKFLIKFYSNSFLKDTVFIIFSDHGEHINGYLHLAKSQEYWYEKTLPALF